MAIDNTWTLEKRQGGVATIAVRSKIRADPNAPPIENAGMSMTVELSGEQTGSLEVDEATGWTLHGQVKQNISGEAKAGGMSWPVSMVGEVVLEVVE